MPSTIFSGSDIKTLKDNLSLNDKAKILPSNGSPAAGAGVAAPVGSLALDYTNGKTYKKIGALDTDWSELGSGVGGINYITNSDAEAGTNGWSTYADAAGAQPVDGTGGSPNVTWTRSTTTPLRGTADFNFVKDAANRQGQGVSTDITIGLADQAKILTVTFDYEILSGTYATGDLSVYLIQDPAGTPVVIQPAGYQVQSAVAGTKMKQIATFQTAATGQSYRICFHVASTSASAYTLAIDNVICGPQVVQYGAPVTDWTAYTPTGSWTTNTTYAGYWRRVGDSIEVRADIATSGAPNSSVLRVNLPSGITIDTAKIPGVLSQFTVVGTGGLSDSSTTAHKLYAAYYSTTSVEIRFQSAATSTNAQTTQVTQANPITFGAGDSVNIQFKVPVVGWSSTVQMSNDTDTRVVAASATRATTQSLTANVTDVVMTTSVFDTHGAYNTSTGAYVAPVSGYYSIGGVLSITVANSCSFVAYVDASSGVALGSISNSVGFPLSGVVYLNAGQSLTIRADTTVTLNNVRNAISINRLSGPSAIAASEDVIVSCIDTSGTTIGTTDTDAGRTLVPFASEEIDTHGSFSSGVFTAPISGKYEILARFQTVSTTAANAAIHIYKNGTTLARGYTFSGGASINHNPAVFKVIALVAGDTVEIRGRCSTSLALDTGTNPCGNLLSIKRIGN